MSTSGIYLFSRSLSKIENKKLGKYQNLARELKKGMNYKVDCNTNHSLSSLQLFSLQ